jgi:hypothetical protein
MNANDRRSRRRALVPRSHSTSDEMNRAPGHWDKRAIRHALQGLDEEKEENPPPLTLIVGVLVWLVPSFAIFMVAAFAAYSFF